MGTLLSFILPIIIGHRGAAGYLPEHTIPSYTLAIEMGADFIEPDLVITKDGVLVARHENEISTTTDVKEKFPERKRSAVIDGYKVSGWFVEDFTLAELKTLRTTERFSFRSQAHNGLYPIPTFEEIITLAKEKSVALGRPIGLYPELKHPTYFRQLGKPLEPVFISALKQHGLNRPDAPLYVQSFEVGPLKEIKNYLLVPLIQLLDHKTARPYDFVVANDPRTYGDLMTDSGLQEIATYAKGIGSRKDSIIPLDQKGNPKAPTDLVARAHARGLLVHPYTFRSDEFFLPPGYQGNYQREYLDFLQLNVDGLFSDFADQAVTERAKFINSY